MDRLHEQALLQPAKAALLIANTDVSIAFGELDERSSQIARKLAGLGLAEGSAIALLLGNSITAIEAWWGARRAGLYYVPINPRLSAAEIAHFLSDCGAMVVLSAPEYTGLAQAAVDLCDDPRLLVFALGGSSDGFRSFAEVDDRHSLPQNRRAGRELLYSSGTTGRPKAIKRPLVDTKDLPALEQQLRAIFDLGSETVFLATSPLHHAIGRFVNRVIEEGGTAVILPKFTPEAALSALARHKITHSHWVPTMFVRLLDLPPAVRKAQSLPHHRIALHAGSPCAHSTKRAMLDWWGPIIHEYYGGTENAGVTFITAQEWLERPGSVGKSITGAIHIMDEVTQSVELPVGETGLICFEGGVPFSYGHGQETTANPPQYATYGDLGQIDADGYLTISDRRSDLIISGGTNIYPREVELLLETHPAVREVAVIGLPDPVYGQRVHAVVALNPGYAPGAALEDELIGFCRMGIATFKAPRTVAFIDDLPRNEHGKLLKRALRDNPEHSSPAEGIAP